MRVWLAFAFVLLAVGVVLPALDASSTPADSAPVTGGTPANGGQSRIACGKPLRTGRYMVQLTAAGLPRSALVNVPPGADGRHALPVMIALHGAGGWGRFMETYSGLTPIANRAGFISVYPSAAGKFWQLTATGEQGQDDVQFIRGLLDQVIQTSCVDVDRVYVTGVSNGAGLVARIGCEMSDRVAAIAPVAGGYYHLPPCNPDRPVSVLETHGTADVTVPYTGKYGEGSVPSFLAQWRGFDRCTPATSRQRVVAHVLRTTWPTCADGTQVMQLKIIGGTHTWEGTPIGGDDTWVTLSTQQQVVDFFRGKRRSPPNAG